MNEARYPSLQDMMDLKTLTCDFCKSRSLSNDGVLMVHSELLAWYMAMVLNDKSPYQDIFKETERVYLIYRKQMDETDG